MLGNPEDYTAYTKKEVIDALLVVKYNNTIYQKNLNFMESRIKELQEIIDKKRYVEKKKTKWLFQNN